MTVVSALENIVNKVTTGYLLWSNPATQWTTSEVQRKGVLSHAPAGTRHLAPGWDKASAAPSELQPSPIAPFLNFWCYSWDKYLTEATSGEGLTLTQSLRE